MTTRGSNSIGSQPSSSQLCFSLMRLHHFPVGTKLPFTALALCMYMGVKSIDGRVTDFSYTKAGLWWLFIFVRHSGGCVWDDICDRDIDRLVERTKGRPLASGKITLQRASCLLLALLLLSLLLLHTVCNNIYLFSLGLIGIGVVDMPYPLMKRWINLPQLIIGASTAWPLPIAWMSVTDGRYDVGTLSTLCVAFGGITFILDTIYACQDIDEDIQLGVGSSAVSLACYLRVALSVVAVVVVINLFAAGVFNGRGCFYFLVATGGVAICLMWQIRTTDFGNREQCGKALAAYSDGINMVIWAGLIGDCILCSHV